MVNSSLYNLLYKKGQNGGSKIKSSFSNFSSLLNDKKGLMIMVFANLITQLGITYYVMTNTSVTEEDNHNLKHLLLIIATFIIIWILALVPMPSWLKFILFSAFSYIWGILLASFKLKINDNDLINMTMLGSIGIFAVMFFNWYVFVSYWNQIRIKNWSFFICFVVNINNSSNFQPVL